LTLSARAMLRGLIGVSKVEVISPDLTLVRRHDGVMMFGLQALQQPDTSASTSAQGPTPTELLGELLSDSNPDHVASYLRSVSIIDGKVAIEDRAAGVRWTAAHVNFDVGRNDDATLGGRLRAALPQFGAPALGTANVVIDPGAGTVAVDAAFQGLDLASLGLVEPKLALLANADVILSGRLSTQLKTDGSIGPVDFQVN